jgi:hypothetical protein
MLCQLSYASMPDEKSRALKYPAHILETIRKHPSHFGKRAKRIFRLASKNRSPEVLSGNATRRRRFWDSSIREPLKYINSKKLNGQKPSSPFEKYNTGAAPFQNREKRAALNAHSFSILLGRHTKASV